MAENSARRLFVTFFLVAVVGLADQVRAAAPALQPLAMRPLPLGSVKAEGWLKRQLRIQADGLSGHLDEFWPDVKESGWFGGGAEGWERAPYWLDGVIPLAFTLDDEALKNKVHGYIETILDRQHDDGSLGPKPDDAGKVDLWSHFLALKMLAQYQEATGDARVAAAMEKELRRIDAHVDEFPLRSWAQFRWFEALLPIYQVYEQKPEPWLLELAEKLRGQGFDWPGFFEETPVTEPTPKGNWNYKGHVVNNAMAIKAPALVWRLTGNERDRTAAHHMLESLDTHHGMATGIFTGDECLAGKSPVHGTELCAVVEFMFSLEMLLSVLGDPAFGDRLEKIAFNALPATFSPDMWSHQYDQQANQVMCTIRDDHIWNTNGPDANIFGLEPNYGCCTSNLSQGWPKFAAHLWMKTADDDLTGLAAVAYGPSTVTTEIGGVPVEVRLQTDYPFRDKLHFTVTVERPVSFPLLLRVPDWADGATLEGLGEAMSAKPGTFHKVERQWEGTTELVLTLPMKPLATRRYNQAIAIERGPLVYALSIGEEWKAVHEGQPLREPPHGDWEVYPTSAWNYALDVSPATVGRDSQFVERPVGDVPFSPAGAPVVAEVQGIKVPEWKLDGGRAGDAPKSPVAVEGTTETLTLIPYGCTNLRITEFPTLK